VATLSVWERGSHLYGPQEFEVYLYPTRSEYEAKKMPRGDQGLELELHYHLGKVNVVADALSRKAHYKYLPTVCSTGEESSTRVLPDLSVFNITITPTLRSEIITAQKRDKGMMLIKGRI
jgi:hypothetical protein